MKPRIFKILIAKLEDRDSYIYDFIDDIKKRVLRNKKELYAILTAKGISEQAFIREVFEELHREHQTRENLNDIIKYFGKDGIDMFPDTWFTRNVLDKYIKIMDKKFWKRLRSPKWLNQHEGLY